MTEERRILDQEIRESLLTNLSKTRLDLQEFGRQLEEIIARIFIKAGGISDRSNQHPIESQRSHQNLQ